MKARILSLALVSSAALLSAGANAEEKELKKDQVPKPVLEAFAKAQPKAQVKEYEEENWDGKTVYEIEFKENGVEHELFYAADGTLLLTGEEIKAAELPPAVAEAAKKAQPKAAIKEVKKKLLPDGTLSRYEVEFKIDGGKELELEIDANGNILKTEQD